MYGPRKETKKFRILITHEYLGFYSTFLTASNYTPDLYNNKVLLVLPMEVENKVCFNFFYEKPKEVTVAQTYDSLCTKF